MARKSRKFEVSGVDEKLCKTAVYLRLSRNDLSKGGCSIETQDNIIEEYMLEKNFIGEVEKFIDNGKTGTNFERPAFKQMLEKIEKGKINCVIVKDLSRLGRNLLDTGYYIEKYFPLNDVRFIAVTDNFDSLECGTLDMMLSVKNVINERYAKDISVKVKSSLETLHSQGKLLSSYAPFGYKKSEEDKYKMVVDEKTAPIVKKIFQLKETGESIKGIARILTDKNVITPSQRKYELGLGKETDVSTVWGTSSVRGILESEMYIGNFVYGKTKTIGKKRVPVDKAEWKVVENNHEAIIDERLFRLIQQQLESNVKNKNYEKIVRNEHLLDSKVYCENCKSRVIYKSDTHKGVKTFRLTCRVASMRYKNECNKTHSIREDTLISLVEKILLEYLKIEGGLSSKISKYDENLSSNEKEIAKLDKQIKENTAYKKSLYENLVDGLIDNEEYINLKNRYEYKNSDLELKKDVLEKKSEIIKNDLIKYNDIADIDVGDSFKLTREIVDRCIDKIFIISQTEVNVKMAFDSIF